MSEENTHNLNGRSFEDRVMARFDAMDIRFDSMDARFGTMENRVEGRFDNVESRLERLEVKTFDTKPIWERALAELAEVKTDLTAVKADVAHVKEQVDVLTADMTIVKERLQIVDYKFDTLIQDVMDVRTHQRYLKARIDRLESS